MPVIGIGAGPDTDGQILVLYDVLDITQGRKPRFVRNFMAGRDSALEALQGLRAGGEERERIPRRSTLSRATVLIVANDRSIDAHAALVRCDSAATCAPLSRGWRAAGERVAFVPTMGNLHAGHVSLIGSRREHGDASSSSIFVNPMQFGPNEDFAAYPRTPPRTRRVLDSAGTVDLLFVPDVSEIYPFGLEHAVRVALPRALPTSSAARAGPAISTASPTVVAGCSISCTPDVAVFGEKDYQQLTLMRPHDRGLALAHA